MELLDLSKAAHHDTITLPGGTVREVINQTDLGVWEFARLHALQAEAGRLDGAVRGKKVKVTPKQTAELLRVLGEIVKILIPTITAAELKKLSRANREQIVLVWILNNSEGEDANPPVPAAPTGAGSSRASKRSSGATRSSGGTSRNTRLSRT